MRWSAGEWIFRQTRRRIVRWCLYFSFAFFHIKYASFGLTIAISPLRRSFCVGIFSTQRQFARKRLMASCRSAVQSC